MVAESALPRTQGVRNTEIRKSYVPWENFLGIKVIDLVTITQNKN